MKTSAIITIIGVIIILAVAGLAFFRSTGEEVVSPDPTPPENETGQSDQLFQQEIEFTPEIPAAGQTNPEASPAAEAESATTVRISETGFSPDRLMITPGTTVTFVNDGQALHWPASDIHPTHEILPEFDSNRGLTTGEMYSYTFTKAGTWRFHDHLNPQATGVVVVQ